MKFKYILLLASVTLTSTLTADTIKLKSGKTYQGEVISKDAKNYLIKIEYSATITDERSIPKSEILEIIPDAKDTDDFEKIKSWIPTPDGLTEAAYTEKTQFISSFLKKYPKTTHKKEVQSILDTLKKEQKTITAGGVKINGKLISADEAKINSYDIDALALANKIKANARAGHFTASLREWEQLKKDYLHSEAYQDSLQWIPKVLKAYAANLKKSIDSLDARLAKREKVLNSLDEKDRRATQAVIAQKQARLEARIKKESSVLKTHWLSVDIYSKNSLDSALHKTQNTLRGIKRLTTQKVSLAKDHFNNAQTALDNDDLEKTHQEITKLQRLKIPEKYTAPFSEQLNKKAAAIEAEKKAKAAAEAKAKADAEAAKKKPAPKTKEGDKQ